MFLRLGEQYDFRVDSTSNSAIFSSPDLSQYDAIVFANTNNKVFENEKEKEGLIQFNRQGKGIVGIHIACGTEREWKWFKQMTGGTFDFHPPLQKFNVHVVDDQHPSAKGIPPMWEVEDELYIMKEMNPTVRVLMVSDFSSPDFQHSKPMPDTFGSTFPSVWCNEFDGGRQWFTALGHKKENYSDPLFISHIVGGLQWVLAKKESQISIAGKAQWWGDVVNELGEAFYTLSPSSHQLALIGKRRNESLRNPIRKEIFYPTDRTGELFSRSCFPKWGASEYTGWKSYTILICNQLIISSRSY